MPPPHQEIFILKGSEMPLPWFFRDEFHKSEQGKTLYLVTCSMSIFWDIL